MNERIDDASDLGAGDGTPDGALIGIAFGKDDGTPGGARRCSVLGAEDARSMSE